MMNNNMIIHYILMYTQYHLIISKLHDILRHLREVWDANARAASLQYLFIASQAGRVACLSIYG